MQRLREFREFEDDRWEMEDGRWKMGDGSLKIFTNNIESVWNLVSERFFLRSFEISVLFENQSGSPLYSAAAGMPLRSGLEYREIFLIYHRLGN